MTTKTRSPRTSAPRPKSAGRERKRARRKSDLDKIIAAQRVKPIRFKELLGKWPGEKNDGFEDAVDEWRHDATYGPVEDTDE